MTWEQEQKANEDKAALAEYWTQRLDEFESQIYPVFASRGYSKNTALTAYMIDDLDTALMISVSQRGDR